MAEIELSDDMVLLAKTVWYVCTGLASDPTRGATRFHRHELCPGWSAHLAPSTLIGEWIYYAGDLKNAVPDDSAPKFLAVANRI